MRERKGTKILYAETYIAPGLRIREHVLPTLPSATPGFKVVNAFVMKAGSLRDLDGDEYEFQDVRIYLKEIPMTTPSVKTEGD